MQILACEILTKPPNRMSPGCHCTLCIWCTDKPNCTDKKWAAQCIDDVFVNSDFSESAESAFCHANKQLYKTLQQCTQKHHHLRVLSLAASRRPKISHQKTNYSFFQKQKILHWKIPCPKYCSQQYFVYGVKIHNAVKDNIKMLFSNFSHTKTLIK